MRTGVDGDPLGEDGEIVAPHDTGRHRRSGGIEGQDDAHRAPLPGRDPGVGVADSFETDVEVALGESFGQALAPLHDDDRVGQFGVQVQRVQLTQQVGRVAVQQPVDVDVDHRRGTGPSWRMHPRQHVGR